MHATKDNPNVVPHIDRNKCEGKGACVAACPYAVFGIFTLPKSERRELSIKGKLKGLVHQWQQAEMIAPDQCHGCGLCVTACPEKAITLVKH